MKRSYIHWAERMPEIQHRINAGESRQQIADSYGVSIGRLKDAMHRHGVKLDDTERRRRSGEVIRKTVSNPAVEQKRLARSTSQDTQRKRAHSMRLRHRDPEYRRSYEESMKAVVDALVEAGHYQKIGRIGGTRRGEKIKKMAEQAERLAAMTPFERQLELVRTGRANIVRVR